MPPRKKAVRQAQAEQSSFEPIQSPNAADSPAVVTLPSPSPIPRGEHKPERVQWPSAITRLKRFYARPFAVCAG